MAVAYAAKKLVQLSLGKIAPSWICLDSEGENKDGLELFLAISPLSISRQLDIV